MRQIKKGSTDRSVVIRIIDSTDGTPETGVVYNTSGIAMWYRREGATVTAITEATLAGLDSAHSDGGFLHISDGYYRLDLPDAAFATGASHVMIGGAVTGMIVIGQEVQLVNYDPEDTVRLGLTALPNAAADAAGGLAISDAGGLDLDAKLANTNEITAARMGALTDWINGGRLDLLLDACAVESGGNLATILARVIGTIAAGTHNPQSGDSFARLGAPAGASIAADLVVIDNFVDGLESTIGAAGAGLTAVPWNAAWDAEVQSECADALAVYDPPTNAEMEARTLPSADYTIVSDLPVPPTVGAIADQVWDEAISGHLGAGSTGNALSTASSGGVDPAVLADAVCDEVLSGHTTAGTLGKVLSDAATAAALATVDGIVDDILVDTGTTLPASIAALPTDADVNAACDTAISDAALATAANLAVVDGIVDSILVDTAAIDARLPTDPADESLLEAAIATRAAPGDSMALTTAAVDAVHDEVVEGTTTMRQSFRLLMSALFGKVSGAPTGPIIFRDIGDTKARITATVDADGNRTAITRDAT